MLAVGTRLGPYEITGSLGAGGMGEVYRARDARLDRDVAVKILAPALAGDARFTERFDREARVVASLNHPHICTLHDIGDDGGTAYLVMEYLEGQTLAARLRAGRVPIETAVAWGIEIADALELAHGKGVVHRDLKPGNLFVVTSGAIKILDFGLAKSAAPLLAAAAPTMAATDAGTAVGTVAYMSPEQARAEGVDARSDLFSFGLVLYELATGQVAFPGTTTAVVFDAILNREVAAASRVAPGVPASLERLIARATAKSPAQRPQSSREMLDALRAIKRELDSGAGRTGSGAVKVMPSIAVLPFADLSAARDHQYFCEGMAEEIITALSGLAGLRVASRTSAVRAQEKALDVGEIGRRLNAQVVLEGSVRKAGNRLRISAQLTNADDGYQLWAGRYDRDFDDVFAIQDEIARAIAAQLKIKLFDGEDRPLVRHGTTNLEAYNLYLKGRYHWERRNQVYLRMALHYFEQAVAADPGYALAYAGLSDAYLVMAIYGARHPKELYPQVLAAAERAQQLDPDLAEAHHSLGAIRYWLEYDWAGSDAAYTRAIELNPRLAITHGYRSILLATLGRHRDAAVAARRAVEMEPDSALIASIAAATHYWGRDTATSTRLAERALEIEPNVTIALWILSLARWLAGDMAGAVEAAEAGLQRGNRESLLMAAVGATYARAGRTGDAEAVLAELHDRAEREYVVPLYFAELYTALGRREEALDWLERAYEDRNGFLSRISGGAEFDPLRSEPRFIALMRCMNLLDRAAC